MVQAGFCQRMAKTEIISSNGVEENGRCKMNTTPQTLPQMKQEDMPLHKLMNGSNDSRQPVDKILLDGQTLKSSELKTYGALR
jgi:hypothetical protein